ncbi:MAG: acetolactate synthase small subunit [Spirochaetaceae bacterium]|jgi:acetolactate synthase-1/3 small subunit|nr:acetolactate synthase small subunit [Spirochaetaceae bacterium]
MHHTERTQVVSVLVENRSGTLSRVSGLFARRGFNIDSLTVGETVDRSISRMTIAVTGDEAVLEQIIKQLGKLVDVIAVRELDPATCMRREIMLVKVGADETTRPAVIEIAGIFRSRVVDVSMDTITIEATGDMEKLNGLMMLLLPYGILELARTGMVALERGAKVLSTEELPANTVSEKNE